MTIYEQQRGKNKQWRLVKEEGAEIQCSRHWNSPTDLQNAQKPHKTNTVCRPALRENQQIFGLLTMNQPQLMWAFTNNVKKKTKKTAVYLFAEDKNSQSSSWPMFQSSLSLRTVLHKKMKLFLPSHGNLLPEIEQGKPKKVHKFQSGVCFFFFSVGGDVAQDAVFVSTGLWIPTFMLGVLFFWVCVFPFVCMTA